MRSDLLDPQVKSNLIQNLLDNHYAIVKRSRLDLVFEAWLRGFAWGIGCTTAVLIAVALWKAFA